MIVVANWKTMVDTAQILSWLDQYQAVPGVKQIVLCPWPYLKWLAQERLRRKQDWLLGVQEPGEVVTTPCTGVVSMEMLRDCGVEVVCVGHQESRQRWNYTPAQIRSSVMRVMAAHMVPLLCVPGMRDPDDMDWLDAMPERLGAECWIAYEPDWAIGGAQSASPEMLAQQLEWLDAACERRYTKEAGGVHWFYGGSVNADNVASFLEIKGLSGLLVGRASAKASDWKEMLSCM